MLTETPSPLALTGLAILIGCCTAVTAAEKSVGLPPMIVHGIVETKFFAGAVPLEFKTDVTLYSSNSWWRIIATQHDGSLPLDCMPVPGGLRVVSTDRQSSTASIPTAEVTPTMVPEVGHPGLLAGWLAFCPDPRLPILKRGKFIQRFELNRLQNNPSNFGRYSVKYLNETPSFISKLVTRNAGYDLSAAGEAIKTPKQLEGYTDLTFEVLDTTNAFGVRIPSHAILRRSFLKPGAKTAHDTVDKVVEKITVTTIELLTQKSAPAPYAKLMVLDSRYTIQPNGQLINYLLKNEQWVSTLDSNLLTLEKIAQDTALLQTSRGKMPPSEN